MCRLFALHLHIYVVGIFEKLISSPPPNFPSFLLSYSWSSFLRELAPRLENGIHLQVSLALCAIRFMLHGGARLRGHKYPGPRFLAAHEWHRAAEATRPGLSQFHSHFVCTWYFSVFWRTQTHLESSFLLAGWKLIINTKLSYRIESLISYMPEFMN